MAQDFMNLNVYQTAAIATALPSAKSLPYMSLGLAGEAGEVANKVKKIIRDGDSDEIKQQITAELGDVLWYVAGVATMLGVNLDEVAEANLDKLAKRAANNRIGGSGDNR